MLDIYYAADIIGFFLSSLSSRSDAACSSATQGLQIGGGECRVHRHWQISHRERKRRREAPKRVQPTLADCGGGEEMETAETPTFLPKAPEVSVTFWGR